jgi:hypothetical protein
VETSVKPVVYIETTIPSFYCDERDTIEALVMRNWTRRWWDQRREEYDLVTSVATLDELEAAPEPKRSGALALLQGVPVLDISPSISFHSTSNTS